MHSKIAEPLQDLLRPLQLFLPELSLSVEGRHLLQGVLPEEVTDLLSQRKLVAIK